MNQLRTPSAQNPKTSATVDTKRASRKPQEHEHERPSTASTLRVSPPLENFRTPKPVSYAIHRWLQQSSTQEPWTNIAAIVVPHRSSCPLYSEQNQHSLVTCETRVPRKDHLRTLGAPQTVQDHRADDNRSPDGDNNSDIRALVFQLYRLCSAHDSKDQDQITLRNGEAPEGNDSTPSETQKRRPSSQKRKRGGTKLSSSEGLGEELQGDQDDDDETLPVKKLVSSPVQELASQFGCWFYKRAPDRYPQCAGERGSDVLQFRRVSVHSHQNGRSPVLSILQRN
jgi:hypothetical protein